jgi:hypothetical protein
VPPAAIPLIEPSGCVAAKQHGRLGDAGEWRDPARSGSHTARGTTHQTLGDHRSRNVGSRCPSNGRTSQARAPRRCPRNVRKRWLAGSVICIELGQAKPIGCSRRRRVSKRLSGDCGSGLAGAAIRRECLPTSSMSCSRPGALPQ